MRELKKIIEALFPASLLKKILSGYHFLLASVAAFSYGFPAQKLLVIGVTGTKGKTTVTEMINGILEKAGYKTCLTNSIRFKIAGESKRNVTRMSMPGRFFIQSFLQKAVKKDCSAAIIEMTSEGARQHRHRFTEMNALVFLNLAPEHIESHGSYQDYADAKFELGRELLRSQKRPRIIVANGDDAESLRYLALPVEQAFPFSLDGNTPFAADDHGGYFTLDGGRIEVRVPGIVSLQNALAAATVARALGISVDTIKESLSEFAGIRGRLERIEVGQRFTVVIDYAHTPDSLRALYEAYKPLKKICVLGAAGGGRDMWKRPEMGKIAEEYCDTVILTDEDPFDENPEKIVKDIARGMQKHPMILMDRRTAISRALEIALSLSKGIPQHAQGDQNSIAVLISGKGSDPSIAGAHGAQAPWSDAAVAREELKKLLASRAV